MVTKRILLLADINLQLILFLLSVYFQYGKHEEFDPMGINVNAFICFYFILGGWQVVSCILHAINDGAKNNILRIIYHMLLILHVVMPCFGLYGLAVLACTSPVMALYYFIICIIDLMKTYYENE
ncbi:MAG TPA: hypothetical protein VK177_02895 [Flavobacteriales bacterium]|nr:hypothetical protein [Flavobacteriales bacterium]